MKQYYEALATLSGLIASPLAIDELLQRACEHIVRQTDSAVVYIALVDPATERASVVGAAGESVEFVKGQHVSTEADKKSGMGIFGQTFHARKPLIFNNLKKIPIFQGNWAYFERLGLASAVGIPLMREGHCRAVLALVSKHEEHFTTELVGLIERMGDMLTTAIKYTDERDLGSRYYAFYEALSELNDLVSRESEPNVLFKHTCRLITNLSPTLSAAIFVKNGDSSGYKIGAISENVKSQFHKNDIKKMTSIEDKKFLVSPQFADTVVEEKRSLVLSAADLEESELLLNQSIAAAPVRSIFGAPIFVAGWCEAVFVLTSTRRDFFNKEISNLAEHLSGNLGQAILAHRQRQQLERQAMTDSLTGIANRVLLIDRFKVAISNAGRGGERLALAVIDIDGLKEINDHYGHLIGDKVIRSVAKKLNKEIRGGDTLARLGGDEFAAIFRLEEGENRLENIARRLLHAVSGPIQTSRGTLSISISIGFALFPDDGQVPEDLLRRADLAMYKGKRQGGNRWHLFEIEAENALLRRNNLRAKFKKAIENKDIFLHYQPKVDMKSGAVLGVEALARWRDAGNEIVLPGSWIPIVESDFELSAQLGRYVLSLAVAQLKEWEREDSDLMISVNVSARHLQMSRFYGDVRDALKDSIHLASRLCFEVTETALIEDFENLNDTLRSCRELGIRIALDDFGTGYASLAYLQKLSADTIKIDLDFILHMPWDMRAFSIVAGTLQISQMTGVEVVAEGVETEEHGKRLLQLGCRYAQGFFIAPALPANELGRWRRNWEPPRSWSNENVVDIVPERHKLIGTLVYHRSVANMLTSRDMAQSEYERISQGRCPLSVREGVSGGFEHEADNRLHRHMHQIENVAVEKVARGAVLSERESKELARTLAAFEKMIDAELDL